MRDDFPEKVKGILAKRVGFLCSNPNCRRLTMGPGQPDDKTVNIGVAAHITAAAPGGKRYDSNLSPVERASHENGIWLCQTCAKLIDDDDKAYRVGLLREWKATAEHQARIEVHGTEAAKNEFDEETFQRAMEERRAEFFGMLTKGDFDGLLPSRGLLCVMIVPHRNSRDIAFYKHEHELRQLLEPMGVGGWNYRYASDYFENYYSENGKSSVSVARLYRFGRLLSASRTFLAFPDPQASGDSPNLLINDWAVTHRTIKHVFNYLKLMDKMNIQGPHHIGVSLFNLPASRLIIPLKVGPNPDQGFAGGNISAPFVTIQDADFGKDWRAFAPQLQNTLDYIWRGFTFRRCLHYADDGRWIGGD